jgi:tripartite-type tricarboxylate transporter receptor subunit TctC
MFRKSLASGLAALLASVVAAGAQNFPTKSMTMIIPFAAGGPTDVLGRVLGQRISEILGRQIVIENVGGAGGMSGSKRAAEAAPDGYTFVLGTVGTHAQGQTLYKRPLYNAATDFTPVALIAEVPIILIVRKDLPPNNLQDFVTYTKANQAKMQYGSSGAGATPHLACSLLNAKIGVQVTHIPYRGTAPAAQDMLAGRLDYMCPLSASATPQIESGQVKAIAVLAKQRSPVLPNLASALEQGLADLDTTAWNGFFLPKGTPAAIVQKLNEAASATIDTPSVRERLREIGVSTVARERRSPDYLQKFVEGEIEKWAAPIKSAGVTAE